MENISIEVLPSSILSLSSQRGRCRTTRLQDYRVQEYRLIFPPYIKCNVLRESLSEDSQNIPCATLKKKGSWVISLFIYLITSQETPRTPLWTTIWRGTRTCRTRRPSLRRLTASCPQHLRTEIIRPSSSITNSNSSSISNSISWGAPPRCTCRPRICTTITTISTRV